eukprot:m.297943 g.297943  ORF g.297943 m.297943 type:complete len:71 (+) comp16406_c0_seq10:1572-1784(+)
MSTTKNIFLSQTSSNPLDPALRRIWIASLLWRLITKLQQIPVFEFCFREFTVDVPREALVQVHELIVLWC